MKTQVFERPDGSKGESYHLEDKDEFTARFDKAGSNERAANVKQKDGSTKPTIIKSYFIGVTTKDGKEVTLTLTPTQFKQAEKHTPLKDKKLIGRAYKNKYGDQVALDVK